MIIWVMGVVLSGALFYAIYLARLCVKSGLFSIRSYEPSVVYKQKNNNKFIQSILPINVNTKRKLWSLFRSPTRRRVLKCLVETQTVYGASIRIKCSSKNLYDMMRSVDNLSIWNSISPHRIKEDTSNRQIIHTHNNILTCTNVLIWLFEPLFNHIHIIERTFVELPTHRLIYEHNVHQQNCTIYIIQSVQGREHDQSMLSVITDGDIYTVLDNISYIDDYYIMLRTPTQLITKQTDTSSEKTDTDGATSLGVVNGDISDGPAKTVNETPNKRSYSKRPDKLVIESPYNPQNSTRSDNSVSPEAPVSPAIVDYRTLANKCAADLLAYAHEASTVAQRSKDPDQQPTGWIFNSTDRDVAILFKLREGQNTCCWLGKALIKVHPDQIWTAISNPYTRHIYDELLKEVSILCDMEDGLKLMRFFYQTSQLLRPDSREFIVLQSERQEKRKRLLCLCSVESPQPEDKACPRGRFNSSGWIIEPVNSKRSVDKVYSMVTYITNIDMGGGDTSGKQYFEDEFLAKQPLAVAELRDYLKEINRLQS